MAIGLLCAIVVVMCALCTAKRNEAKLENGKIHPRKENTATRVHDIP